MTRERLTEEQIEEQAAGLKGWNVIDGTLRKRFEFANFAEGLNFVNRAGELAEAADHHPDIKLGWGYAEFAITTHDRGGLTELDFGLASKIDQIS